MVQVGTPPVSTVRNKDSTSTVSTRLHAYRIDDLIVEVEKVRVSRDNREIPLAKLSFDLLLALIEIAPAVATSDYLLERVWPGLVVNTETVSQRIKLLRAALDDDSKHPRYLAVVRGRGYRLVPVVSRINEEEERTPDLTSKPPDLASQSAPAPGVQDADISLRLARFRRIRAMLILCTLGLVVAVVLALVRGSAGGPAGQAGSPAEASSTPELPARAIAVLPFSSLGPNGKDSGFLASGIAESVLHALASTGKITVIARSSSFAFKDQNVDAREIGRRLNARYLLEGSLQQVNQQLRVRADLIDAATGQSAWSMAFDRPAANLYAIEDEIAVKVARALAVTVNAGADDRLRAPTAANIDAYLEYLQGRERAATYRLPDLQAAIGHYERAIQLDPSYSAAYSGLAWAKFQMLEFRTSNSATEDWKTTQVEVRRYLDKALALDSRNADAWQTLAAVEEDPDRSEVYNRRAVALEPGLARAQFGLSRAVFWHALTSSPERVDEALGLVQKAIQLDPLEPRYPTILASHYYFQRPSQIDKAEPLLNHALELDPNYFPALLSLATLHFCCQGRLADAIKVAEQALKQDPSSTEVRSLLVHMYFAVDDVPAAEMLLAHNNPNRSSWIALYAYQRDWRKAVAIMYDEHMSANLPGPLDGAVGELALRVNATDPASRQRAQALIEKWARVSWAADGTPSSSVPMGDDMGSVVGLADLMLRDGDTVRARRLLEMALSLMDTASIKYQRGEMWFSLQRSRALALLGRTEEAFVALANVPKSGEAAWIWQIEPDPIYDVMRNDPRFKTFEANWHALVARERAKVDEMRAQDVIPIGPR